MAEQVQTPSRLDQSRSVVEAAIRAVEAYGRSDLADRLHRAQARLAQPDVTVLVIGEFKQGKSTLVNALLNVNICPTDDDVATVVPTVLRHGDPATASVLLEPPLSQNHGIVDHGAFVPEGEGLVEPVREAIEIGAIPQYATEAYNPQNRKAIRSVEVRLPRKLLETGLAFVDTPGVGGLASIHGAATSAALGTAEAVFFVSDTSQELSATEMSYLRLACERCSTVVLVATKVDLYPEWRRIVEVNRAHIANAGLNIEIYPVSSVLRQHALAQNSTALNEESGFPPLVRFVGRSMAERVQARAGARAADDILFVTDQLEATFQAERQIVTDPERAQESLTELKRTRERAQALQSAEWRKVLGDGSQDMVTEVEFDLRRRMRELTTEVDAALETHDPADIWDEFSAWLRQRSVEEVSASFEYLRQRANYLATEVAGRFALDEQTVSHAVHVETPTAALEGMAPKMGFEETAALGGVLTAMRGSYGGILMFGMVGQMVGLALLNPLTIVAGIGLGRRALQEEKKRQLTIRQQQAKQSSRRYADDVQFTAAKEIRDAALTVNRELRDEFTSRAEELQNSSKEALRAAETAAKQTQAQQQARLQEIDAELGKIATLRQAATQLSQAATGQQA